MKWSIILLGSVLCLVTAKAQADDRPALGITMRDSASDKANAGVVIDSVVAGSPAAQAGLSAGDRITAIDSQPVSNSADVIKIIGASGTNKQVTLDVTRGAWRASLPAMLRTVDQVFRAQPVMAAVTPSCCYQNCWQTRSRHYHRFFSRSDDDDGGSDSTFVDGSE